MSDSNPSNSHPFRRIVLVDDEPSVLLALRLLLQAIGFEVRDFPVAEEALRHLSGARDVDLVICDLRMPKLTGLDVLNRLRTERPDIPFVLMSAHANAAEVKLATERGAVGFLAKPFSPDTLRDLLTRIVPREDDAPQAMHSR